MGASYPSVKLLFPSACNWELTAAWFLTSGYLNQKNPFADRLWEALSAHACSTGQGEAGRSRGTHL